MAFASSLFPFHSLNILLRQFNICPFRHITLTIAIASNRNHSTVRLQSNCMTISSRDRYNICPFRHIREIVDSLNERGLKTSQNKPFRMNSFDCILKNRKYVGEYRYQDVVIPGGVPAIVSQELFDRVQAKKKRNKHAPAASKADVNYLLSTKLFCGKCGTMMVGESGTGRNGAKHYYYKCGSAKRKTGCTKKAVKKEWIENLVLTKTLVLLSDDKLLERLSAKLLELQQKENTDIPILKRQLDETKRGIENLLNAIQQGILTPSTKERLEQLEETKEQLEISLTQAEQEKPLLSKKQILFWLHRFRGIDRNDPQQCQRLIDSFVNSVYVFDDKLLLTFNYHDGTETISLQDIDGSDLGGDAPPKIRFLFGVGFFLYFKILITQKDTTKVVSFVILGVFAYLLANLR